MDVLVSILVLCLSAGARSDSSQDVINERSNGIFYSAFGDEFEPIAFATVPLHQMPTIRIVSPSINYKLGSQYQEELEPSRPYYARQPVHSSTMIEARVTEPSPASSEQQAPEVIYARPNKRGGYTYRRPATARRPPVEPLPH